MCVHVINLGQMKFELSLTSLFICSWNLSSRWIPSIALKGVWPPVAVLPSVSSPQVLYTLGERMGGYAWCPLTRGLSFV